MTKPERDPVSEFGHPSSVELRDFGLGRLDTDRSERIERHLHDCEDCARLLETLDDGDDTLLALVSSRIASVGPPLRVQPGYEILEELGRGGMSVVYRAKQLFLDRVVALKRIRAGLAAGPSDLIRFRREAKAVSTLDHPHIVPVYDAGEQDGEVYLAMEYLAGGTLAERLARSPLSPIDAVRVIRQLAGAIAFAHDRGIIHRDIKPSNVLLVQRPRSDDDSISDCMPKIADFGLAKWDQDGGPAPSLAGMVAGTPSYMAPEQTSDAHGVGPAADVYALGATLYECLVGRPPFRGPTVLETLEQVREQEPVPPSKISPHCPRDVETICLKCLEKQPARRYGSPLELAADLDRLLRGEPIQARRASPFERAWKWARRRPVTAALLAALMSLLTLASMGGWWVSGVLRVALQERTTAQQRAERNLEHARDAWNGNLWTVSEQILADVPDTLQLRQELLETAVRQYEELFRLDGERDPTTRNTYHMLLMTLAQLHESLEQHQTAEQIFQQAARLAEELLVEVPNDHRWQGATGDLYLHYGLFCYRRHRFEEAEGALLRARQLLEAVSSDSAEQTGSLASLAHTLGMLASIAMKQGKGGDVAELLSRAIELAETVSQQSDPTLAEQRVVATVLHNAALLTISESERRDYLRRATDILRQVVATRPASRNDRASLANSLVSQGTDLAATELEEGVRQLQEARLLYDELASQYPQEGKWRTEQARSDYQLATLYGQMGRLDEAKELIVSCIASWKSVLKDHPTDEFARLSLLESRNQAGLLHALAREMNLAEQHYRDAVSSLDSWRTEHGESRRATQASAASATNLAELLRQQGRLDEALEFATQAVRLVDELLRDTPDDPTTRWAALPAHGSLAVVLQALGQPAESIRHWDRVIELADPQTGMAYRFRRALAKVAAGLEQQAVEEANSLLQWEGLVDDDRYNLACLYALCAQVGMEDLDREPKSPYEVHIEQALAILTQLKDAGYFANPEMARHAQADSDLHVLRADARFSALFPDLD